MHSDKKISQPATEKASCASLARNDEFYCLKCNDMMMNKYLKLMIQLLDSVSVICLRHGVRQMWVQTPVLDTLLSFIQ